MSEGSKFACPSCGKEFRWKREIAGKRAKCKCGATVQVPASDPAKSPAPAAPDEQSFDDLYALAATEAEQAGAHQRAAPAPPAAPTLSYAPPPSAPMHTPAPIFTPSGVPMPRRAKIDNTPSSLDWWHNFWRGIGYAFLGLLICAYGVFEFFSLTQIEARGGGRHRMRIWIWLIYMVGGRWAVLIVIGGLGVLVVLAGVLAMFGKLDTESDE